MIGTALLTLLKGKEVGIDQYGNKYYQEKFYFSPPKDRPSRRWVVYKGISEGSKVPAEWHGWLHYTTDKPPSEKKREKYFWEKSHLPNLSGTKKAYKPVPDRRATNYAAWIPNEKK